MALSSASATPAWRLAAAFLLLLLGPIAASPAKEVAIITTIPTNVNFNNTVTDPKLVYVIKPQDVQVSVRLGQEPPKPSGPICGAVVNGRALPACPSVPARFEAAAVGECPAGSFFDLGKWECWKCPPGYKRSLYAIDSDKGCTKEDPSVKGKLGPATYRGPLCPAGTFHDPIRGGECWTCPPGYRRSLAHIDADNACYIPAGERFARAIRHQRTIWPHDCKDGRFHDIWDGGSCWSCPGGYRRTGNHIADHNACVQGYGEQHARATVAKQAKCEAGEFHDVKLPGGKIDYATGGGCYTCPKEPVQWDRTGNPVDGPAACSLGAGYQLSKGELVSPLTCKAGQIFDLVNLTADDIRTRPELKGRNQQPIASGTCWSCPAGYARGTAHVKSGEACMPKTIGWYTVPFEEPGLFGLPGASAVLLDITRRHPALIQTAIQTTAAAVAKANNQPVDALLAKEKEIFATNPQNSTAAAGAVFVRLLAALADPAKASAAEKQLVESFRQYVIKRRTYVAQNALEQYNVWKETDDHYRRERSKGPQTMQMMLDYGTVPPDFSQLALLGSVGAGVAGQAVGVAVGSLPVVGEVIGVALSAAGNGFADFSKPGDAVKFLGRQAAEIAVGKAAEQAVQMLAKATARKLTQDAIALGLARGAPQAATRVLAAAGGAGPQLIIGSSLMILSIAIDQVNDINNAYPKLLTSLATAKADPNLARLAVSEDGLAELLTYWSYAIGGESQMAADVRAAFADAAKIATGVSAPTSAPAANAWRQMPGAAVDIGMGANGSLWVVGANAVPGGFGVYRWNGQGWDDMRGGAVRIDVDPQGNAWVANDKGEMFRFANNAWHKLPGLAKDIGVGPTAIWHIGTNPVAGGFGIYRWTNNAWQDMKGGAVRIDVDPQGNAWVVNDKGDIFRWTGSAWAGVPGKARDIGIGGDGSVFVLGPDNTVHKWNGSTWIKRDGLLSEITVDAKGVPFGVNGAKQIWMGYP